MRVIKLQGTNLDLTPQIKDYLNEKLEDIDKFLSNAAGTQEAQVELAKTTGHHQKGEIYRAEIMISLKGKTVRAESTEEDIRQAIDEIKEDISREIKKYKEKKTTEGRKGARLFKKLLSLSPLARGNEEETQEIEEEIEEIEGESEESEKED